MAIGKGNELLWRLTSDLKRFKSLTTGHPIIMGRRTFESIGRALPERTNIVISRNSDLKISGCLVVDSLKSALSKARKIEAEEIFLIGGAQIYKEALPLADRLYVTEVDLEPQADTFFLQYKDQFTKEISRTVGEENDIKFSYVILEK